MRLRVIHTGVGAITESDVMLASASQAIIIGFNVRPRPEASALAEREGVDIRTYRVIYRAIEDVRDALRRPARAGHRRGRHRPARGARDVPGQPHRHHRGLLRHRRRRRAARRRCACSARAPSSRGSHRVAQALQRGHPRGRVRLRVRRAARGLQRRQGRRHARGVRAARGRHGPSAAPRAAAGAGRRRPNDERRGVRLRRDPERPTCTCRSAARSRPSARSSCG